MRNALALVVLVGCASEPDSRFEPVPSTLLVTDRANDSIVRYDGITGARRDIVVDTVDRPSSVRVKDDRMYIAGFGHGEISRFAMDGAAHDVFFANTEWLEEPVELVFAGDRLVVLGHDTQNAVVIDPAGSMIRELGYPDMRAAHDLAIAPDGKLYVGTDDGIQIWDLETATRERTIGDLATATSIAFAGDELFAVDTERGTLVRISDNEIFANGLVRPVSVDVGPDGALDVLDAQGIHRYDPITGEFLSTLVGRDAHMAGARSFTFVTE